LLVDLLAPFAPAAAPPVLEISYKRRPLAPLLVGLVNLERKKNKKNSCQLQK